MPTGRKTIAAALAGGLLAMSPAASPAASAAASAGGITLAASAADPVAPHARAVETVSGRHWNERHPHRGYRRPPRGGLHRDYWHGRKRYRPPHAYPGRWRGPVKIVRPRPCILRIVRPTPTGRVVRVIDLCR